MLLNSNSEKVMSMLNWFEDLTNIEKIRLSINILESSYTNIDIDKEEIIATLNKVLNILDETSKTKVVIFSKYKKLTFITSKYLELTEKEKTNFIIEMLFNLYQTDFNNNEINTILNNELDVYNKYYTINN